MATEPKSSGTVCVACKLPHGLRIQFYDTRDLNRPAVIAGEPILLAGSNHPHAVGGYGITTGVDGPRFGKWLKDNENFPAVRAGLIFAEDNYDRVRARAQEQESVVSGFERLDPDKPGNGVAQDEEAKQRRERGEG